MKVKINGKDIEIAVSEGGMFHDAATSTTSATTLKGLIKKLRAQSIPVSGIPVIRARDSLTGVVIGRVKSKGWRKNYFTVNLTGGGVTEEYSSSLHKPKTDEEKELIKIYTADIERLKKEVETAKLPLTAAESKLYRFNQKFEMCSTLDTAFPKE